ncbi:MAG TPA: metallophosphoesterase family protein [Stellaceae bacterium]|nr:metallophosphoesterase family protein [Stellaceae bacterium]
MIGRFFAPRGREEGPLPAAPPGTRLYAIGDIHGRIDLLRQLTRLIEDDAASHAAPRKVIVYLGDYVDRGDHSREVIERLLREPVPGFESVHLKGNHEDFMVRFLDDVSAGPGWLSFGGMETLESYGVAPPPPHAPLEELLRAQRELGQRLPQDHVEFLRALLLSHAEGDYFFAHAGVKPGVALERQREQDLLWIRDEFLLSEAPFGRVVVHGHTIAAEPVVRPNRIGIDTGAFKSGRLTALVAEGTERAFLQT